MTKWDRDMRAIKVMLFATFVLELATLVVMSR